MEQPSNASLSGHFMNVVKSFIGSNYLAIPHVFLLGGIYFGSFGMGFVAILTGYCCTLLVRVRQTLRDKGDLPCSTYGQVTNSVLGWKGYALVEAALLLTQFGFCVGYMVFMGTALQTLFDLPFWASCLLLTGPLIAVTCVRELSSFTTWSYVANLALFVSFVLLVVTNIYGIERNGFSNESTPDLVQLPIFFGVIIACFEGIGTVLPVEGAMGDLNAKYPKLLWIVMGLMTVLFSTFGILGVGNFGSDICGIILDNLIGGIQADAIKACIVVGLFFTYAFQMFPVTEILEGKLARGLDKADGIAAPLIGNEENEKQQEMTNGSIDNCTVPEFATSDGKSSDRISSAEGDRSSFDVVPIGNKFSLSHEIQLDPAYEGQDTRLKRLGLRRVIILRIALVSMTTVLAIAVPDFILLISFVGSLGASFLAFIMPCILAEKVLDPSPAEVTLYRSILCLGFVFMALGSSLSLWGIIEVLVFNKSDSCG